MATIVKHQALEAMLLLLLVVVAMMMDVTLRSC